MAARIVIPPSIELPDRAFVERAPSLATGARVWLVRHAEVHADFQQRAYGNTDVPLSSDGEAATRAMGAAFAGIELARVTSSDLARARAMGQSIANASGAELVLDARLREVWRGAWQLLPTVEFRRRWEADAAAFLADPWNWNGHGGESDAQLCARVWPAFTDAVRAANGRTLVIAAHYNVMRVLVTRAMGLGARASFAYRNDPAHATLLVDAPEGWRLELADAERPITG